MSRRPDLSAPADVRSIAGPSRRAVLAGAAATPLLPIPQPAAASASSDEAAAACDAWLARHAEAERLSLRWQRLETYLAREHNLFELSEPERLRFPQAREMDDILDRLDVLGEENEALLRQLPTIVAATDLGIAGKLAVAALEECPDQNRPVHLLIASILRDFKALRSSSGR
jgi:hypothetical protein